MAGEAVKRLCEFPTNSAIEDLRLNNNAVVSFMESLRKLVARQWADRVVYSAANSGAGAGLSVDANAPDVETDNAIDIMHKGVIYPVAAQGAIDISAKSAGAATIAQSKCGAAWVFAAPGPTIDVEVDIDAATYATAIESLARYIVPTNTLPPSAGMVPIGVVQVTEGGSGAFTWGTDSITDETETYYSLNGLPGIHTAAASFIKTAGAAATIAYGAGKLRLGTGTLVSYTGKTGVAIAGSTIPNGHVGAYVFFVLADDVEYALPIGVSYTSLEEARAAVAALPMHPLMPPIAAFYIENGSGSPFIPGTTTFDTVGVDFTADIEPALTDGIDGYADFTGYQVDRLE